MITSRMSQKLAAALTAGIMMSENSAAFADNASFETVSINVVSSASGLPSMISTVAYIGGIGLGVAGIFKLKAHVDQPAQNAMKDGLVRLGAGGGLLALPYLTQAMQTSINGGSNSTTLVQEQFAPPTFNGG